MSHYHIVWEMHGESRIDCAPFESSEEAKRCAISLVRPDENYEIAEYPNGCSLNCAAWKARYRDANTDLFLPRRGSKPGEKP